jgi:nitroreductase
MPDALELLKTRRSVSAAFLGDPGPNDAELAEILTIAARVPDHGKLVPWRFIVFKGEARKQAGELLAALFKRQNPDATEQQLTEERNRLARAPLVVGVVHKKAMPHPKVPEWEQMLSAGNAAMSTVMAAHALGYTAQWTSGWLATDDEAGKVLGLQPGERFVAFVHIGTSTAAATADRARPPLDEVVSYWAPPAG